MGLSLLVGPANAGKVSRLLERYLEAIESDPYLIVPNRPDVDRAERWLLGRTGALFAGEIGTFDDLFRRVARSNGAHRPVVGDAQRRLLLRRVVARAAAGGSSRVRGLRRRARLDGRPSSSRRSSSRRSSTASWPSSTAPTARSSTGSASGTASSSAATRPAASQASSTPGTAARCSRTGSRT